MSAVTIYRRIDRGQIWERLAPYAFIAPFFIGFFAFQLFPIAFSTYLSVAEWNPYVRDGSGLTYVGLQNFKSLLTTAGLSTVSGSPATITITCTIVGHRRCRF